MRKERGQDEEIADAKHKQSRCDLTCTPFGSLGRQAFRFKSSASESEEDTPMAGICEEEQKYHILFKAF
ncbi:hypothetical protein PUN28_007261 [Cardiocondyla obscurior]|uniref:Uncharacterized protein n=1 Tax=Cardiocondyla obscurior TaxID=286306 RepID=A0AAW2G885_9HYME